MTDVEEEDFTVEGILDASPFIQPGGTFQPIHCKARNKVGDFYSFLRILQSSFRLA